MMGDCAAIGFTKTIPIFGLFCYLYSMTNAKISRRAEKVLKNKNLSSAIASALAKNSHALARNGVVLKVGDKEYIIKAASAIKTA